MDKLNHLPPPHRPSVLQVGDAEHAELHAALRLLRETSSLTVVDHAEQAAAALANGPPPELIVLAQRRPGTVRKGDLRNLERLAPLAGVVWLLGSWCEGQARTARPMDGIKRLYWYEFPSWWARQLVRRGAGRCPEWARPEGERSDERGERTFRGLIAVSTADWESFAALADQLSQLGYAAVWQHPGGRPLTLSGVTAGIWDGGQLDEREETRLAAFCSQLARDAAPVAALLDFPREDRCRRALEIGAAAVLGKPWLQADLIDAIQQAVAPRSAVHHAADVTRAA